jgi:3-phosphoshikimate 1-carboxyvinyltransferase
MIVSEKIIPVSGRLSAEVLLPGSKSITNRVLILSACCSGRTLLDNVLESEDTQIMIDGLRKLGVPIEHLLNRDSGNYQMAVIGLGGKFPVPDAEIYIGNSGTSVRFLTALLALSGSGEYRLHGKSRMHKRPISDLVDALRLLGGNIRYENNNGSLPLIIGRYNGLDAGLIKSGVVRVSVSGGVSSQFLSGLLMAIPVLSGEVDFEIVVEGELVSRPYVEMTIGMMRSFGVGVIVGGGFDLFRFRGGEIYSTPEFYCVEPDASAASYFFAAAAVCGGSVQVKGLSRKSVQGDIRFVDCLAQMGCEVQFDEEKNTTTVTRPLGKSLCGISVDMNSISDTAQTLGVVALFAEGETEIRNIEHVRYKETDRIADLATELRKFGAAVEERRDGLRIIPPSKIVPATVDTYDDHRMAMSFAVAGLKVDGVVINNPECVQKTFPNFFKKLQQISE